MKVFSQFNPVSPEYLSIVAKKANLRLSKNYLHPQEDYLMQSERYPIFVVADGVTLKTDKEGNYPNPSGAGELAKIFCHAIIREAETIYDSFKESDLKKLFVAGNKAAGEYNLSQGRIKEKLDYREFDLFAATTSFALVKEDKVYWWSLCDAGVALFNEKGMQIFHSPTCWPNGEKYLPERGEMSETEWNRLIRRVYRNGIDKEGNLIGYGVVTGEERSADYLNTGILNIGKGDTVMIYTDGFEQYLTLNEFINLFRSWPEDIRDQFAKLSERQIKEDPDKYGHERSLFVIKRD